MEDGAALIMNAAIQRYEDKFEVDFPLYEHLDLTSGDGYDVSAAGAKRLSTFIDGRIEADAPVEIPEGYEDRLY
ncbi:hypothetical protein IV87_GL001844 [Pediococcus ethanolidurans]|uniref:Uncharacterized protein n=1 Tax=Pediococcus ethanolidurans TaxID=319653 RepID=A0A0R2K8D1_9LACO|nr:hypothetical protein IV87_GL001844 [Pediococcus ethanolidurans]